MDAMHFSTSDVSYGDEAPVLIGASSERAAARARRTIEAAGRRIADCVSIESAQERIARQAAAAAVWIEIDSDGGAAMDSCLAALNRDAAARRYAAVVASTAPMLDAVVSALEDGAVDVLVDADDSDRAVALALAGTKSAVSGGRLSDVASDQSAARLRQLSDEVSRIAQMLSRLSTGPGGGKVSVDAPAEAAPPVEVSAETVRSVIRARRLRTRYFPDHLFADPGWDMLLDLFQAEIAQLRVPVSSLCIAAAVPATTALRWLKTMVQEGIFVRRADPHDGRRVFVELAPSASDAMRRYFSDIGKVAVV